MIKKVIWTTVFIVMGFAGSLTLFGISDMWTTLAAWIKSMKQLSYIDWNSQSSVENMLPVFTFLGATFWTIIVFAPLWYLWKGTGVFIYGDIFAQIVKVGLIVILYLFPTILGMCVDEGWIDTKSNWVEITNIIIAWIVIAISLLGLWLRS